MRFVLLLITLWAAVCDQSLKPVFTQVTYMFNVNRSEFGHQFKGKYEYYLSYLDQLLTSDSNIIIFGEKDFQDFVWKRRKQHNTVFVEKQIEAYKDLWYYPYVQKLRQQFMANSTFPYKTFPQFAYEYWNPIMMGKLYVMTEALKHDKWNTDILVWTDADNMRMFRKNIVSPENVIEKFYQFAQPQWTLFTLTDPKIFMGYKQTVARYISRKVEAFEQVLTSNMGGDIKILRDIKCAFENLLRITLENGDMNSDKSVITMMPIRFPFLIPSTAGINLSDMSQKIHIYQKTNKLPQHKRFLKGIFDSKEILLIDEGKNVTKYDVKPKLQVENKKEQTDELFKLVTEINQLTEISNRQHYFTNQFLRIFGQKIKSSLLRLKQGVCYFAFLVLVYLIIACKSKSIKKELLKRVEINENPPKFDNMTDLS